MPQKLEFPRVEYKVSELSNEEWFAVTAIMGLKPDASAKDATDFRMSVLGMPREEQQKILEKGFEGLVAKKILFYELDKNGRQIVVNGRRSFRSNPNAKILTEIREVKPKNLI